MLLMVRYLCLTTLRRMPTANPEAQVEPTGSVGKVSARRVRRYLWIGTGPRYKPSARSEISKKNGDVARGEVRDERDAHARHQRLDANEKRGPCK